MTLTGMDFFVVLAQERSFTRAAKSLHITQQSLSAHIASIERELGACFCPEDLVRAVLTEEQRADLHCIRLGDQARYPIRFGYRERPQPWRVLTAFLTMAQEVLRR